MKIGTQKNLIEELDREQEHAIALAVKARFRQGDVKAALREVDRLTVRRLDLHASVSRIYA